MPEMQKSDVSTKLSNYLYCHKKKNKPRMHYSFCEICRYNKNCIYFKTFRKQRPDLYPPLKSKQGIPKKKKKK
jgi:hypothetical protein